MTCAKRRYGKTTDNFPSPSWTVRRLLEAVDLPGGWWLEPCVGDGAIVRAVAEVRDDVRWTTVDVREGTGADIIADFTLFGYPRGLIEKGQIRERPKDPERPYAYRQQFLYVDHKTNAMRLRGEPFEVCLTNPPFSQALGFLQVARKRARIVAFLLRLGWLASAERNDLLRCDCPDVYVLPDRPSFVTIRNPGRRPDGRRRKSHNDSADYAWMVWPQEPQSHGRLHVLDTTPLSERRRG